MSIKQDKINKIKNKINSGVGMLKWKDVGNFTALEFKTDIEILLHIRLKIIHLHIHTLQTNEQITFHYR